MWKRFSKWNKPVRVVALVLKISKHWLSLKKKNQSTYQTEIFIDDLVKNKYFIIKMVQQDKLARGLTMIKLPLHKSIIFYRCNHLSETSSFMLEGDWNLASYPRSQSTQLFFPKTIKLKILIVEFIRKSNHHCGRDHLVSLTRERYWIVLCKSVFREVINVCLYCKRQRVKLQEQLMSDLSEAQSAGFNPPFTHTVVDYFNYHQKGKTDQSKHRNRQKVKCSFYMLNV